MKISDAELFEMNLYYREVIGREGAPAAVKQADIIKLLDHIAEMSSDMEARIAKQSEERFANMLRSIKIPGERRAAEIQPGTPKPGRAERRAAARKKQQTTIFDYIGGES